MTSLVTSIFDCAVGVRCSVSWLHCYRQMILVWRLGHLLICMEIVNTVCRTKEAASGHMDRLICDMSGTNHNKRKASIGVLLVCSAVAAWPIFLCEETRAPLLCIIPPHWRCAQELICWTRWLIRALAEWCLSSSTQEPKAGGSLSSRSAWFRLARVIQRNGVMRVKMMMMMVVTMMMYGDIYRSLCKRSEITV